MNKPILINCKCAFLKERYFIIVKWTVSTQQINTRLINTLLKTFDWICKYGYNSVSAYFARMCFFSKEDKLFNKAVPQFKRLLITCIRVWRIKSFSPCWLWKETCFCIVHYGHESCRYEIIINMIYHDCRALVGYTLLIWEKESGFSVNFRLSSCLKTDRLIITKSLLF